MNKFLLRFSVICLYILKYFLIVFFTATSVYCRVYLLITLNLREQCICFVEIFAVGRVMSDSLAFSKVAETTQFFFFLFFFPVSNTTAKFGQKILVD